MKEALVSNVKWYDNFYDDLYCYKYIFILFENFLNALKMCGLASVLGLTFRTQF